MTTLWTKERLVDYINQQYFPKPMAGFDSVNKLWSIIDVDSDGRLFIKNLVWNTVSLDWEAATGGTGTGADVEVNNFPAVISGSSIPLTKIPLTPAAPAVASVGVVSAQVLAANANRKGLYLINTSANYISIGIDAAAVLYSGITLNPSGGCFWMDEYSLSTAAINAIASGAASNLAVQEFS